MSDTAKKKAKQRWAIEKPRLDNARQLRGILFIEPNDEEFQLTMKAARRKLEDPMPGAMPSKNTDKEQWGTHRNFGGNARQNTFVLSIPTKARDQGLKELDTNLIKITLLQKVESHGHYIKTTRMRRTSSGRNIRLHPGQNGRCTDVIPKFLSQNVQIFGCVYKSTNGQNHGPVWKMQSFLSKGMYGHPLAGLLLEINLGKFHWNTVGKKFQVVNVYSLTEKRTVLVSLCGRYQTGKQVRAHDIPHHLINGGDFGFLERIPENRRRVKTRHPLTRHICVVQNVHKRAPHNQCAWLKNCIVISALQNKCCHLVCHMSHPWLFSHAPSSTSTSYSSVTYPTTQ